MENMLAVKLTKNELRKVYGGKTGVCDLVVGGAGVALSAIYGGAAGMVNPALGIVVGSAVSTAWIPVSSLCP